jgi:hypothetical protein
MDCVCASEGVSYIWAEGIDANDFAMDTINNEFDKAYCVGSWKEARGGRRESAGSSKTILDHEKTTRCILKVVLD